jgi:hypothetical protein
LEYVHKIDISAKPIFSFVWLFISHNTITFFCRLRIKPTVFKFRGRLFATNQISLIMCIKTRYNYLLSKVHWQLICC